MTSVTYQQSCKTDAKMLPPVWTYQRLWRTYSEDSFTIIYATMSTLPGNELDDDLDDKPSTDLCSIA